MRVKSPAFSLIRSVAAFVVVGLVATLWHYGMLKLLTGGIVSLPLAVANVAGYCSALMISYLGNRYFVFTAKRNHLDGFFLLALGSLIAIALHTGLVVGLAEGSLLGAFDSWLAPYGGRLVVDTWTGFFSLLPQGWSQVLQGETPLSLSTTAAFICATFASSVLTYAWNRFVVFQPKHADATKVLQNSPA